MPGNIIRNINRFITIYYNKYYNKIIIKYTPSSQNLRVYIYQGGYRGYSGCRGHPHILDIPNIPMSPLR